MICPLIEGSNAPKSYGRSGRVCLERVANIRPAAVVVGRAEAPSVRENAVRKIAMIM